MTVQHQIPTIDLSDYLTKDSSPEARARIIEEVKDACSRYGFIQIKGHGVPVDLQRKIIGCCKTLFDLPQAEKDALSLKKNVSRRGYERIGDQTLDSKALPDQKEGFYIGREIPPNDISFLRGPNQWPELPEENFHGPITEYYKHMLSLCNGLMEILVIGLGHNPAVLGTFMREPVCNLKLLHYPPHNSTDERLFGAGAHTDFGGITILLQQPGKNGLQVYYEPTGEWLPVPAVEDVFVVNLGDLVHKWTDGTYRSTVHRVINAAGGDRYSVPCFFHGDVKATNPFKPGDGNSETVEEHIRNKFDQSYGTDSRQVAATA
ncbi:putative 2OG-Fe(II) oxygenase family oxidoreductase [Rhizodiscina lignyota]|uniref:2OG-Fe(II) oxygenase family oxidoreductase n=1 Tax=Rhizodiscina lignyota TaxID=1504668 RepID=A0A9P4M4S3_9PEZI|nr:putative 2OG-Fe(II) oxygenase family oxidoreductase [Rhizodiscina lignyota]